MILKYVLKNFSRRKVRTILMMLALLVSTSLIVAMSATVVTFQQSIVDIIADEVGRADLAISKKDTSLDLFMPIEETSQVMLAADERIKAVHPRIEIWVDTNIATGRRSGISLTGLDSTNDQIGTVNVVEGEYLLGDGQVALQRGIANEFGLSVGDTFNVSYALPVPREPGKPASSGTSSVRYQRQFTVSAIVNAGDVTRPQGVLAELDDLQTWLNRPGQANQILAVVDPVIYQTSSADAAALTMREIARAIQLQMGDDYLYQMEFVAGLVESTTFFLAMKALINTYGLISLGVVGLLVYTLVMTNVQEQRRDMAVLRILGSQRRLLFGLVIVEVVVIGLIGVSLGIFLGQALTNYAVVPLLKHFLAQEGLILRLVPQVSISALLPPVISAFIVLIISSLKPAREASRTKVIHAINPSVADNIQLEDLAQLRERRPDGKMFVAGAIMTFLFILITSFEALGEFGGEILQIVLVMLGMAGMVLGVSLMFFILTVPFERLVLAAMRLITPRLTYFARRNVTRGKTRNTLIAMLVLFSAVLPSFLGTQVQLELTNSETNVKMWAGAPLQLNAYANWDEEAAALTPSFARHEFAAIPGIVDVASLSYPYSSLARDHVGFRQASVDIVGVDGDLSRVLYAEMMEFTTGGPEALGAILTDPGAVIISEGLADYMAVGLGETIKLDGEGLDHFEEARIVGIARRLPGVDGITRSRITAQSGSTVLVSLPFFTRLVTELEHAQPGPDDPLLMHIKATYDDSVSEDINDTIYRQFGDDHKFWVNNVEWEIEEGQGDMMLFVILLLALTGISFTTAVFGVFAVIYITIYARRIEIGMLKSMGMLRWELTRMLIVEAIAMTLGSALAGIVAGATMAYVNYYVEAFIGQRPVIFTVDKIVMPAIIITVVLASMLAAAFSARRIVRKQAVEILRMS
jgi:ABC-type antimicrobial peptide transport system permease subunit